MASRNRSDPTKVVLYLREWREAFGFSLEEFASLCSEDYYFVQGRETGRRKTQLSDMEVFQRGFKFRWTLLLSPPPKYLSEVVDALRVSGGQAAVDNFMSVLADVSFADFAD